MESRATKKQIERMNPEIVVHSSVHEVEFWKRYRVLLRMIKALEEREHLILALQGEGSIPEMTRDQAVGFIKVEHAQNLGVFHDFLVNFINMSLQGLHHVDISLEFSFHNTGPILPERICIHVDQHRKTLPCEEGQRFISALSWIPEESQPDALLVRLFKGYQERYDRGQEGNLNRCRLVLMKEVYPGSTFHATLRLPAEVFIEPDFGRIPTSPVGK